MGNFNEKAIKAVCEACWHTIAQEDFIRHEAGDPPLTDLQVLIIYQRYQDMVVLKYPSKHWDEASKLFDRLFKEIEEYHKDEALVYA